MLNIDIYVNVRYLLAELNKIDNHLNQSSINRTGVFEFIWFNTYEGGEEIGKESYQTAKNTKPNTHFEGRIIGFFFK